MAKAQVYHMKTKPKQASQVEAEELSLTVGSGRAEPGGAWAASQRAGVLTMEVAPHSRLCWGGAADGGLVSLGFSVFMKAVAVTSPTSPIC